jgi:hypothetical protein
MSFTVVASQYDERCEDGLLRGVANGLAQLFPLPDDSADVRSFSGLDPRKLDDDDRTAGDALALVTASR